VINSLRVFLSSGWDRVRAQLNRRQVMMLLLLAAVYVVAAKLGLSLAISTRQVTAIWPPTGIALAVTLIGGYRFLPGIFLGAFTANLLTSEPAGVALGIACGNTLEAFIGTALLRRLRFTPTFEQAQDFVTYLICAGLIATAASATIGTLSLGVGGLITWPGFAPTWLTWWLGDMMGGLIVGPFLLTCAYRETRRILRERLFESILIFSATLAVSVLAFTIHIDPPWPFPLAAYIIFPVMIWASFRLAQIGVTATTIIVSATALCATLEALGPFAAGASIEHNLIFLQSFVLIVFASSMFLAITVARRSRAEHELQKLTARLQEANQRATDILADVMEKTSPTTSARGRRELGHDSAHS
jgi:integral membrane sensor domain MASE1